MDKKRKKITTNDTIYDLCNDLQERNGLLLDKVKLLEKENKRLRGIVEELTGKAVERFDKLYIEMHRHDK